MFRTLGKLGRRQQLAIGLLAAVLVLGGVGLALWNSRLPSDPDQRAAIATSELLTTTQKLQRSFSQNDDSSHIVRSYLGYLDDMQRGCTDISHSKNQSQTVAEGTATRLNNSAALCNDLIPLVKDSRLIYKTTEPILAINAHAKRYQTLPLISSLTRNRQVRAVNTAVDQLSDPVNKIDFPTQALPLLKQLQSEVQHSSKLKYYPALRTFQNQLLAERQQYWTEYADLGGLIKTLQNQLQGYCEYLQTTNVSPKACRKLN